MDITEIVWLGVDWILVSGYGPVVGSYEHGNEPSGSIKGMEFILVTISFSRGTVLRGVGYDVVSTAEFLWGSVRYGGMMVMNRVGCQWWRSWKS
jgi:hypothetical protein